MTGTIKKKTDRGFGFISVQGDDKDLFFHSSALVGVTFDNLSEGAIVSFEVETGADGRQKAKNVTLAQQGEQSANTETAEEVAENAPDRTEESPAESDSTEEEAPKA